MPDRPWRRALLAVALAAGCRAAPGNPSNSAPAATSTVAGRFVVPPDLEVTLWAETPMLRNPTNLDVDAKGRVWVTEAVNYRTFMEGHPKQPAGDRVVILEDTDGDGAADSAKTFVQDTALHAPLGLAVLGDQVVVSSSPSVLVYTDADGDDRPERREVLLTGFGGYDHDHALHAFVAGPDGRWYFNVGNAGPHVVADRAGWTLRSGSIYAGGTPHNPSNTPGLVSDDGRVWTGGLALRIRPDGRGLTVIGHNFRNSYEVAIDSRGDLWQNDNDDEVLTTRTTWLMEGGNAGFFSADGSRSWRADQRPGQDLFTAHWHQDDPGVIPAGDRVGAGAPTGVVVVEGDELGRKYRGLLLSADAGRNSVFGYRTTPRGAGYHLERSVFLSSIRGATDDYLWNADVKGEPQKWFRPSDVAVGTDGALFVADWYDPIVGGHAMFDTGTVGRIYRIAPKGRSLLTPEIDLRTTAGQIRALLNPAVNVRHAAFMRLRAQGAAALPAVKALLRRENPYHRARAVWLLAQLGPEGVRETEALLSDRDTSLRLTAYRALRAALSDPLPYARRLTRDPSPAVRREVALSLRDVPLAQSADLISELAAGYDGADRWYLEALGQAALGKEDALYPLLRTRLGGEDPARWDARFAGIAWRLHAPSGVADLAARAGSAAVPAAERARALVALAFVNAPAAAQAMAGLTRSTEPEITRSAAWWLDFRRTNDWRGYAVTGAAAPAGAPDAVAAPELRRLRAIVRSEAAPLDERVEAAVRLAYDGDGGAMLLGVLADGGLPTLVTDLVRRSIYQNPERHVRVLAEQFFPRGGGPTTEAVARLPGDTTRGQRVFLTYCAACHSAGTAGADLGPDLSQIGTKLDRAALLGEIIHPSRTVAHGYAPSAVTLRDGTTLLGFVLSDGPVMVLRDPLGRRHTVERSRVDRVRPLAASIMPRPAELRMNPQEVADVAAWLLGRH